METIFIIVLIAVAGYEGVAIVNKRRQDTISEKSWSLRNRSLWGRMGVDTLVIWLLYHIVIDDTVGVAGTSYIDLAVVAGAIGWSVFSWRRKK